MLSTCKNWCRFHVSKLWTWMKPTSSFLSLLVSNLIHTVPISLNASVCFIESDRWASHARLRTSKGAAHTTNCFIISYIFKYSAIQDIATWILNHYLANVDLTFPGGRNLFLSGYLHRGASEIFTMAAVGVEAWGNLGGFCWIRAANWRSSWFTINIINHRPITMFDPQSSIIS